MRTVVRWLVVSAVLAGALVLYFPLERLRPATSIGEGLTAVAGTAAVAAMVWAGRRISTRMGPIAVVAVLVGLGGTLAVASLTPLGDQGNIVSRLLAVSGTAVLVAAMVLSWALGLGGERRHVTQ